MDVYSALDAPSSLLIVGNGFDCSLGARTRYEDFYTFLLNAFNATSVASFVNVYKLKYNFSDLEFFFNTFLKEKENNYFVNYFVSYNKAFNCWVDFESELKRIISSFDELITVLRDSNRMRYHGIDLCIKIRDKIDLASVILNYPDNRFFSSDIYTEELFTFDIKGTSLEGYKNLYNGLDKFVKTFPNELYKDLSSFSKLFSLYLFVIREDASYGISHSFAEECKFVINYNYTDYLEHYYKRKDYKLIGSLYINGRCDFVEFKDKIVFGIDSNVSIKNKEFFIFSKAAQRSAKETDMNILSDFVSIRRFSSIIVFGHSLNTADKDTLSHIFNHCLGPNGKDPKIIVYCYDNSSKLNAISNLNEILGLEAYTDFQINNRLIFKDIIS